MREGGPVWWSMEQILEKTELIIAIKDLEYDGIKQNLMAIGPIGLMIMDEYEECLN